MAGDCGGAEAARGRKGPLRGEVALIGNGGGETEGFLKVGEIGKWWIRDLKEVAIVGEVMDGDEAQAIVVGTWKKRCYPEGIKLCG